MAQKQNLFFGMIPFCAQRPPSQKHEKCRINLLKAELPQREPLSILGTHVVELRRTSPSFLMLSIQTTVWLQHAKTPSKSTEDPDFKPQEIADTKANYNQNPRWSHRSFSQGSIDYMFVFSKYSSYYSLFTLKQEYSFSATEHSMLRPLKIRKKKPKFEDLSSCMPFP